jgi:hypothetical protein
MKVINTEGFFDHSESIYPSELALVNNSFIVPEHWRRCTIFGYSIGTGSYTYNNQIFPILEYSFFSLPVFSDTKNTSFDIKGTLVLFVRHGFIGQTIFLGLSEKMGRLSYVDGCSDSLLVFPPRLGDASLNLLYLPENISQTEHTHPTLRFGLVVDGHGTAQTKNAEYPLKKGDAFVISEHELHRFKTKDSFLRVVAFHPDGDFGPTDNNHSMINRSYFKKGSLE